MRINVVHTIGDLADDLESITRRVVPDMRGVVSEGIREGAKAGKSFARRTSGAHGKHYPKIITAEMTGPTEGEWGPDSAMPQGGMSFERGSMNQPPHNDIAKSGDLIAAKFGDKVSAAVDRWFW